MITKLINWISAITIVTCIFLIGTVTFWLNYPYEPITINKPITVIDHRIRQGDTLYYTIDYCKNVDSKALVTKTFVDGFSLSLPDVAVKSPRGCQVSTVPVEVPNNLPKGEYVLRITLTYKVNPIRDVEVTVNTETFEVI